MPLAHDFDGTTAVVTGSSSGIGQKIALSLAAAGCTRQVVHCRANREGGTETSHQIGSDSIVVAADQTQQNDRANLVGSAVKHLGRLDTWVFNAGADILTGEFRDLSFDEKLRRLLDVDVIGTIELARQVADQMKTQATGDHPPSMTFIGWDQAPRGMEGEAGQLFGPVKAAVMAFAMSLAQDLAPSIRVNVVAPGWIRTAWGQTTRGYWDDRARSQALMNRWGRPEDVAAAVLYAANPRHTFATGQIIEVNGGWNRRFENATD